MKALNVSEAKTHFSSVVEQVEQGEVVLICKRNVPVAKLSAFHVVDPLAKHHTEIGWAKGTGVRIHGDLTGPVLPESDWDMLK